LLRLQTAFATGAASGIGLGIATTLSQAGVKVMLCDIEEEALKKSGRGPSTLMRWSVFDLISAFR